MQQQQQQQLKQCGNYVASPPRITTIPLFAYLMLEVSHLYEQKIFFKLHNSDLNCEY